MPDRTEHAYYTRPGVELFAVTLPPAEATPDPPLPAPPRSGPGGDVDA